MVHLILLFNVLLLGIVNCGVLPADKCKLEDSSCLIPAFQKSLPIFVSGIPEYGVEVLDIMNLDDVKFELAGLNFGLKEGTVKGMKHAVIDDVKWDTKNKKINVDFHADCSIKGHYTASGRVLILPITGDGQMKLKLKNIHIKLVLDYEIEKKDGKDHIKLSSFSYEYDVKDGAHFDLTNLFNGNKDLSDPMLKFLNENWKEITKEFGGPMIEESAKKIFKSLVAFFSKNAIADIAHV
ncbi:PREDICTED: circadian clock-controlled protein-like [Papilio polytes]|uniref:circadian clock-controlled protein-like n=1 Tax=Papilio polytes TaxID=76194 RepID=UPI00067611F2|nr:PREDICTED: circadian clock-controlled protein-like [Papilio polytes]